MKCPCQQYLGYEECTHKPCVDAALEKERQYLLDWIDKKIQAYTKYEIAIGWRQALEALKEELT